jgi:hypothetical protein
MEFMNRNGYTTKDLHVKGKASFEDIYNIYTGAQLPPDRIKEILHNLSSKVKPLKTKPKQSVFIGQYDLDGKLINFYRTSREAAEAVNGCHSAIIQCCNGDRKIAYGYAWHRVHKNDIP